MNDNKSAYLSSEYDSKICQTLPYYEEFHNQIISLVQTMNLSKIKWLDTGCGTGKTASKAVTELKEMDIRFTLCDPSKEMLAIAQNRLFTTDSITYRNISSQELDYQNEFDVVTAIQSHHYLTLDERKIAVEKCYHALKENGVFIAFENICMESKVADTLAFHRWQSFMRSKGKTPAEIEQHIIRRGTEVLPITIAQHLDLMKNCGFKHVELLWFSYLQAGFFAIK